MVSPLVLAAVGALGLFMLTKKKSGGTLPTNTVTGKTGVIYNVKQLSAGTPAKGINTYRVFVGANPVLDYMHDTNSGRRALIGAIAQGAALQQARSDFGV